MNVFFTLAAPTPRATPSTPPSPILQTAPLLRSVASLPTFQDVPFWTPSAGTAPPLPHHCFKACGHQALFRPFRIYIHLVTRLRRPALPFPQQRLRPRAIYSSGGHIDLLDAPVFVAVHFANGIATRRFYLSATTCLPFTGSSDFLLFLSYLRSFLVVKS